MYLITESKINAFSVHAAIISILILLCGAMSVSAQEKVAETLQDLPVNTWKKLPIKTSSPYDYSQMVYAPGTGILHWGYAQEEYRCHVTKRNDVLAFDVNKGDWIPQYNSASHDQIQDAQREQKLGIPLRGKGGMLKNGTPAPASIANGVCWDSKRKKAVYCMRGLMASYDPQTRKWTDMKPKGLPDCYGMGVCYDPVNDEILMFPHYGATNTRMQGITDNVYGHLGTYRYSFKDNTWRWVGDTFGSAQLQKQRECLLGIMKKLSHANDNGLNLVHQRKDIPAGVVRALLKQASDALNAFKVNKKESEALENVRKHVKKAQEAAASGDWVQMRRASGMALFLLEERLLQGALRAEPPARCGTPLVYDSKNKVIVMFGGHTGLARHDLHTPRHFGDRAGSLNDTWIYDCKTKQWREVSKKNRPPLTLWPKMSYDPDSGKILLVTRDNEVTVWTFDAKTEQWAKAVSQPWKWPRARGDAMGWEEDKKEIALDTKHDLLVMTQRLTKRPEVWQQTFVMKLDVSKMQSKPAPAFTEPPPIRPQTIPEDNPDIVKKLKNLPPNKWIHMHPENDCPTKDWGNAACDPNTGIVYYFGGGHSTYQVNDVALYFPGANVWSYAVGSHNDWIPPRHWGGSHRGLRGGSQAHHMRNAYVAVDSRMYKGIGTSSMRWKSGWANKEGPRSLHFYDVTRGGRWRMPKTKDVQLEAGAKGTYGSTHVSAPDGSVMGFGGRLEPYDGRKAENSLYFSIYNHCTNILISRKVPKPWPGWVAECRPFCFVPDRGEKGQILFVAFRQRKKRIFHKGTWIYDIAKNKFRNTNAKNQPDAKPDTVEYIQGQNAAMMIANRSHQWIYSFEKNAWAQLPIKKDAKMGFAGPYAQMVYSPQYGVFVNMGKASQGTAVMRPDVSKVSFLTR